MDQVERNADAGRFELQLDGDTAFADYRIEGDSIVFPHTVVPKAFEGQGVGSRLVEAALDYARAQGLKVVPRCAFFQRHMARHPELHDLVHPDHRALIGA